MEWALQSAAEINQAHWDGRTNVHVASDYYAIAEIVARGPKPIFGHDEREVGPVDGKDLLHLYCHIGTDTLRWAALGASVTGVDISGAAIAAAEDLARKVGLEATFICADVNDLAQHRVREFDVVYASYGAICWIPDVKEWARLVAPHIRPGGFLYIADGHPIDVAIEPDRYERTGYFDTGPHLYRDVTTYTDGPELELPENVRWHHTLGDLVSGVAASGLRIEFLHEHPIAPRQRTPEMIPDHSGWWHHPGDPLPLAFSLKATRPRS